MRTEEELGQQIADRLRAEVGDLEVRHEVLLARIRRRRKTRAVRSGLAVAGVATAVAAAGTTLAIASGGPQPSGTVRQQALPVAGHQRIHVQLDGYLLSLPAGMHLEKFGNGYLVTGPAGAFVIALATGPGIEPPLGQSGIQQVQAGGKTGWWLGNSNSGELWLSQPGLPGRVFLVSKVHGVAESQVLAFAASLSVTTMPVGVVPSAGG